MDLPRDLIELFSAFANAKVRYLLVGGHAVAAHGRPRATKDVDLWLGPEETNIQRACHALTSFGAPPEIVQALRASQPGDIVWMGRAPTRIDFLRSLPLVGAAFLACACGGDVGTPPAPVPCEEKCQDQVALRAVREMTKLAYNLLLQGKPVGEQDVRSPCPLGGSVHVFGNATSNAAQGATEVDLTYEFSSCAHLELDEEPEETYRMTLTGALTQVGTLAAQPSATTALVMRSEAMMLAGTVHDPPIAYGAPDCTLEVGQDGNELSGLFCGKPVGVDLGGRN